MMTRSTLMATTRRTTKSVDVATASAWVNINLAAVWHDEEGAEDGGGGAC